MSQTVDDFIRGREAAIERSAARIRVQPILESQVMISVDAVPGYSGDNQLRMRASDVPELINQLKRFAPADAVANHFLERANMFPKG